MKVSIKTFINCCRLSTGCAALRLALALSSVAGCVVDAERTGNHDSEQPGTPQLAQPQQVSGNLLVVDMAAQTNWDGWDQWGNNIDVHGYAAGGMFMLSPQGVVLPPLASKQQLGELNEATLGFYDTGAPVVDSAGTIYLLYGSVSSKLIAAFPIAGNQLLATIPSSSDMTLDEASSRMYVTAADSYEPHSGLYVVELDTQSTWQVTSGWLSEAEFNPATGSVWVGDLDHLFRLQVGASAGETTGSMVIDADGFTLNDLTRGRDGNLYATFSDYGSTVGFVYAIDGQSEQGQIIELPFAPDEVAVTKDGAIHLSDANGSTVYRLYQGGHPTVVASELGVYLHLVAADDLVYLSDQSTVYTLTNVGLSAHVTGLTNASQLCLVP